MLVPTLSIIFFLFSCSGQIFDFSVAFIAGHNKYCLKCLYQSAWLREYLHSSIIFAVWALLPRRKHV